VSGGMKDCGSEEETHRFPGMSEMLEDIGGKALCRFGSWAVRKVGGAGLASIVIERLMGCRMDLMSLCLAATAIYLVIAGYVWCI